MTGTFRGMFHNRKSPSPMTCRMVARAPGLFDASNPSHIRQEAAASLTIHSVTARCSMLERGTWTRSIPEMEGHMTSK